MRCCFTLLDDYLLILLTIERNSIANINNLTADILARLAVIDAIAIADIEAALGAIPPDRVLYEPGKDRGERGVEGAGIDPFSHNFNDLSAAASPIASLAIGVLRAEPDQDAGALPTESLSTMLSVKFS